MVYSADDDRDAARGTRIPLPVVEYRRRRIGTAAATAASSR